MKYSSLQFNEIIPFDGVTTEASGILKNGYNFSVKKRRVSKSNLEFTVETTDNRGRFADRHFTTDSKEVENFLNDIADKDRAEEIEIEIVDNYDQLEDWADQ